MINFFRPYIATIKDSFREAFASRVLWIMLVVITVILLAIAPLGLRREMTWELGPGDLFYVRQLAQRLISEAADDEPSPGKHLSTILPAELTNKLQEVAQTEPHPRSLFRLQREVVEALNELLARGDFFDAESWKTVGIDGEARELLDRGPDTLDEPDLHRFNRLMLEAAFPDLIRPSRPTSVQVGYLVWDSPVPPMTEQQFDGAVTTALGWFMRFFVGWLGVFIAILVTAPMIPQTLETGSIELLLSKPVSRSLLFLSKFFGGCAFILVNVAYLICGLWLILGLRLGFWQPRLLLCIPVFLFLFAIYFSVSALAGIVWRNAIVSVVITMVFWGVCFSLGVTQLFAEGLIVVPKRIKRIVPAGETLVALTELGRAHQWDSQSRQWEPIFQPEEEEPVPQHPLFGPSVVLGPVYDKQRDRLVAAGTSGPGGRGFGLGASLWLADRSRDFRRIEGASVPTGTTDLLPNHRGDLLAVSPRGVHRLIGDGQLSRGLNVLGVELPIPVGRGSFELIGPDPPLAVLAPSATAINGATGELAVLTRGHLTVLSPDGDGRYQRRVERNMEGADQPLVMAYAGNTILLAQEDGALKIVDATDLSLVDELEPEGKAPARFVEAAPGGRWFAVVYHSGRIHIYDRKQGRLAPRRFAGQGDISAATFANDQTLLVAHYANRVTSYDLSDDKPTARWWPVMSFWERTYRYGISPLYTVCPKPEALNATVLYLLTGQETVSSGALDVREAQGKIDPWTPVWTSALFMICMLALSCLYLRRADL
jgi:hypothetical protein